MLSNHFPSTYGSEYNWLILLVMTIAGALIREFFIVRIAKPQRARGALVAGLALLIGVIFFTKPSGEAVADVSHPTTEVHGTARIFGTVHFQGTPPRLEKIALPASCARADAFDNSLIVNDGHLKNALVRIVNAPPSSAAETVHLDQKGCLYDPRVVVVQVGQPLEFINSDTVFHNIRSISQANENFNEAMPNQNDRVVKKFAKPEVFLQSKCSVHPWMTAAIAVVENSFYSLSGDDGSYSIEHLPAGHYTIEVAHEVLGKQTQTVDVAEGGAIQLDFNMQK